MILIGLGILVILVVVLVPQVRESWREANRAVSFSNMREIESACRFYANANLGEYPPKLEVLVEQGLLAAEQKVGYVYIRPIGLTAYELMLYEDYDAWGQGVMTNLGFIPDEDLFKKVLAETQQGTGLSAEIMEDLSKIRYAVIHN